MRHADTTPPPVQEAAEAEPDARRQLELPAPALADPVRFVHDDGAPAARLFIASAAVELGAATLSREPQQWRWQTGDGGELALEQAESVGRIAAVRLTSSAVAVLPLEAVAGARHVLPAVLDQRFALELPDAAGEVALVLELESVGLHAFPDGVDGPRNDHDDAFADRYTPRARTLDACVVAAKRTLALDAGHPAAVARLPRGSYYLRCLDSTFGWWVRSTRIELDGDPVRIRPQRVPIARIVWSGAHEPERVAVFVERLRGASFDRAERNVPWDVRGDEIEAAITYRADDELGVRYALHVEWTDGEHTRTELGPWEALAGVHVLPGPAGD